ncbi:hypothetical protein BBP40_005975 [Aspergillus hancockii]|nr:hypothetical protein BBP40_005975 [Aspergillus hancockii]
MSPEELEALLAAPALAAPPGVSPNFDNPPSQNSYAWGITTVCTVVATLCLCLRWYVRLWLDKKARIEDILAICAYGAFWGTNYAGYSMIWTPGYYVHTWNLRNGDLIHPLWVEQLILIYGCCYSAVLPLIKTAILIDWCHVFVPVDRSKSVFWWGCMIVIFFQCLWGVLCIILLNAQCRPHRAIWEFYLPSKCYSLPKVMLTSASVQVISDVTMFFLPQKIIWGLHMNWQKKLGVSIIFGVGILASVAACFRLSHTVTFASQADSMYLIGPLLFWACAEMTCGFFIFSVPCLSKLLMESGLRSKLSSAFGASDRSNSGPSNQASASQSGSHHVARPWRNSESNYAKLAEGGIPMHNVSESPSNLYEESPSSREGNNVIQVLQTTDVTVTSTTDAQADRADSESGNSRIRLFFYIFQFKDKYDGEVLLFFGYPIRQQRYEYSAYIYISLETSIISLKTQKTLMIPDKQTILAAFGIISTAVDAQGQSRRRCAYGDDCWPDTQTWNDFNATIGGKLIRSVPSAAVCHIERYDAEQCAVAKESWLDSFWRTNQTGAYSAIVWEMGKTGQCFINTPVGALCDQGLVPHFSVRAERVEDIQASVKFASEKDLLLVTKNTGHDHLGRSSGRGAFSIWTHNLKGIEWHDSFVPQAAPADAHGIPAVTLQAGEQWFDVYQAAAKKGVLVVGGAARTVGAAGGYLLGGGISPFSHYYGLAADNLLEMTIVSADGEHRVLNPYIDPDYFWAVRGGAGSSWGVVTSVTYKTHPVPQNLIVGLVQLNSTDNSTFKRVVTESLKLLPAITEAGYTGYSSIMTGFNAIFLKPNSTVASFNQTFAPFFNLAQLPGIKGGITAYPSTWNGYMETFLQDPNIGTSIQDTSRLLTTDVIQEKADDLAELILSNSDGAGFNFIGKVNNDERDNTAVHDVWKQSHGVMSLSVDWADTASDAEKQEKRHNMVELSRRFTEIVGSDGGTYVNEANPYEPEWQTVFWGDKYERLLSIKRKVDPTQLFVCNRCVGTDVVIQP